MGNCAFSGGASSPAIKVVTSDGGVMELAAPVTAERITAAFPGHAIFLNRDRFCPPLLRTDELTAGELYYLLPLTAQADSSAALLPSVPAPYRISFRHHDAFSCRRQPADADAPVLAVEVWKVKLAITAAELAEIMAHESRTGALIESVRAVAQLAGGRPEEAGSDKWSLASSRKTLIGEAGRLRLLGGREISPENAAPPM